MTFTKGQKASNRLLPPDHALLADVGAGMTRAEMALKYGVAKQTVTSQLALIRKRREAPEVFHAPARGLIQPPPPLAPPTRPGVVVRKGKVSLARVAGYFEDDVHG